MSPASLLKPDGSPASMTPRTPANITALSLTAAVSWMGSPMERVAPINSLGHRSDRYQTNGTNRYGTFSIYSL